jgi:thiamine kinase-like enzyme
VLAALEGGITNRNLLVGVGDDRFVLRLAGKDTELLHIDRRAEREAAERAAALGIGPPVVAFLEPEAYLVTRFVRGEVLSSEALATPARLRAVCIALRAFHESGPLRSTFDCFRIPREHRDVAAARGVVIPDAYEQAAGYAVEIEAAFGASAEAPVPCHNDLLHANFIGDGDRVWLIDWEYAGMNDRYFDLGNLATNNDFDARAEEALLESYFGAPTPRHVARLALMKVMSDFREAMWGVVQQGVSTLDFDYAGYAASHFDRLLANASTTRFRQSLAAAAAT